MPALYEEIAMRRESWGCDIWAAEDALPGSILSVYISIRLALGRDDETFPIFDGGLWSKTGNVLADTTSGPRAGCTS